MSAAAPWFVGVGVVVVLVVVLDRLLASGVLDRPRRERPDRAAGGPTATGAFGELVEIFQPSRVHLTEELDRQRLETDLVGDSAPPVDLDSGVVHLPPPPPRPEARDRPDARNGTAPRTAEADDRLSGSGPSPQISTESIEDGRSGASPVGAEAKPTTNPPGAST